MAALGRFIRRQTDFMTSMLLFIIVRSFLLPRCIFPQGFWLERDCSGQTATGYVSPLLHYAYYTHRWRMSSYKFDADAFLAYRIIAFSVRDRL